jgi:hypothetical protein
MGIASSPIVPVFQLNFLTFFRLEICKDCRNIRLLESRDLQLMPVNWCLQFQHCSQSYLTVAELGMIF